MAVGSLPPGQGKGDQALREIAAAVAANDLMRANAAASEALAAGFQHPAIFNARALWLQQQNRHQEALGEFQRALAFTPRDATLHNAIGLSLLAIGRTSDAVRAFETSISISPNVAQLHYRKGWALGMISNHDASQLAHERAIELDPRHADALASLASLAARRDQHALAREYAQRALAINPNQPTALTALALVELSEKNFAAAEVRARELLKNPPAAAHGRAVIQGLLADALDGQNKVAEAFAAYTEAGEGFYQMHSPRFPQGRRVIDAVKSLTGYFEKMPAGGWHPAAAAPKTAASPSQHVFLLGFMRSGTTLLEQVLATNTGIVALEERELLTAAIDEYMTSVDGLNTLNTLSEADLTRHRQNYWNQVAGLGLDVAGKVFVDKVPLYTNQLPLIAKLFPDAKIIFALRDPRDVVFSCFRRHFTVTPTAFEYLRLEDAARYYAAVMTLAEIYRDKVTLNLFTHSYEDMIADFDGRVKAVCDFIGADWTPEMRDFKGVARKLEIRSPSAAQVRQGLYRDGVAQWRRYQKQLAPILPILAPWVAKFGYEAD